MNRADMLPRGISGSYDPPVRGVDRSPVPPGRHTVGGESCAHHRSVSGGRRRDAATTAHPPPQPPLGGQRRTSNTTHGAPRHRAAARRSTRPRTRNPPRVGGRPGHGSSGTGSAQSACSNPRTPRRRDSPGPQRRSPVAGPKASRTARFPSLSRPGYRTSRQQRRISGREPAPGSAAARYAPQPPILGGHFHTGTTGTFPAAGTTRTPP